MMTIVSRPDAIGSETVHVVTVGAVKFSVTFRSVEPVVEVRGIALTWEVVLRVSDGREHHGYGAAREDAFRSAYESAASTGTLSGVDFGLVMGALCRIPGRSPVWS